MDRKRTLTAVRITQAEPKAAFAGVVLSTLFTTLMASMAAFKEERIIARRFDRWDFGCMANLEVTRRERCSAQLAVRKDPNPSTGVSGHLIKKGVLVTSAGTDDPYVSFAKPSTHSRGKYITETFACYMSSTHSALTTTVTPGAQVQTCRGFCPNQNGGHQNTATLERRGLERGEGC